MGVGELRWGSGLFAFSPLCCLLLAVVVVKPELVIIAIIRYVGSREQWWL